MSPGKKSRLLQYICNVDPFNNPVFSALSSGDAHLGFSQGEVRWFDEAVSPFAGFEEEYKNGFDDLFHALPEGRRILYATRKRIKEPDGWKTQHEIEGTQFLFTGEKPFAVDATELVQLNTSHVDEMVALATLTKPGPFSTRTIEFGHYYGVFRDQRLVAMTGQRLHLPTHTEVSAVCTHPDYLGKGYAAKLIRHQVNLIMEQGKTPFLHVRADNGRAIALYERLHFKRNGPMNFYFMKRKDFF